MLLVVQSGYRDEIARQKAVSNEQIKLSEACNVITNKEDSPLRKMKQYQTGVGGSPSNTKNSGKTASEPKFEVRKVVVST